MRSMIPPVIARPTCNVDLTSIALTDLGENRVALQGDRPAAG